MSCKFKRPDGNGASLIVWEHYGVNGKRKGVGIIHKEEFAKNVLEINRVSDRITSLNLQAECVMLNVADGYAP